MKKVIKLDIGSGNYNSVLKELEIYRNHLMEKVNTFVDALIQEGMQVAKARIASTKGDSTDVVADAVYISSTGEVTKAMIYMTGTDVLFVEFGAGIAYNTGEQHPLASEFGYGPGTYPSEHPPNRGINPGRWVYGHDDNGKPLESIGTEATMPMFRAAEHIRNIIVQKANEVFRS